MAPPMENLAMPEPITVTGLDRIRDPKPTPSGHVIIAYFSADIGVFSIKGLALVRTNRGGLAAWLPNLVDPKAKANRSIALNDEPTRNALLQAGLKMYRMMGGTDAEWQPRTERSFTEVCGELADQIGGGGLKLSETAQEFINTRPPAIEIPEAIQKLAGIRIEVPVKRTVKEGTAK